MSRSAATLTVVAKSPPPGRINVDHEVQKSAHAINTMAGRIVASVGRSWTTEPQIAAAEAECLDIAERALGLAKALRAARALPLPSPRDR